MKKLISNNYPFLILFLLIILKEPIYKIFMNPIIEINTKCDYIIDKYNELLEFSNISLTYDIDYINTYIIYKDQYNFMNEITIRGGNDFDLKNNPVIYNNTLIGVIYKVTQNSSKVRLLTNKDSKISVKVNDEIGMLEYENDMLIMRNINSYSTISIGDKIIIPKSATKKSMPLFINFLYIKTFLNNINNSFLLFKSHFYILPHTGSQSQNAGCRICRHSSIGRAADL